MNLVIWNWGIEKLTTFFKWENLGVSQIYSSEKGQGQHWRKFCQDSCNSISRDSEWSQTESAMDDLSVLHLFQWTVSKCAYVKINLIHFWNVVTLTSNTHTHAYPGLYFLQVHSILFSTTNDPSSLSSLCFPFPSIPLYVFLFSERTTSSSHPHIQSQSSRVWWQVLPKTFT